VAALPPRLQRLLVGHVVDDVNARYAALADELLSAVKKTESSLKRLKKSRPGEQAAIDAAAGAGGAGAAPAPGAVMSDSDKICLQLYLDVQEHGRQIARFGLVPEELESYRQLLAAVTPADKQQPQQQQQQQQQQASDSGHASDSRQPAA
jgi:hypothetical protein